MKVQTRLSIYSSVIFGVIFIIISALIYLFYYRSAEKSIYQTLEKTSYITAWFYLEEDEMNREQFSVIRSQFEEQVLNPFYQIYGSDDRVHFGSHSPEVAAYCLAEIREKGELAFMDSDFFCFGIFYEDNQGDFVVVTKEKKSVLTGHVNLLLWILFFALIFGILAIIVLSRWIAYIAYKPFNRVINQVKNTSTHNLDVKIESSGTEDELQDLIDTVNELLQRISETFIVQKNFVNYVSHEFKTPLAAMLGNLEVFSLKDRSPEEYKDLSDKLITQVYQLKEIIDTLMVISDLKTASEVNARFRIDELVWEIITKVSSNYPSVKIQVDMDVLPEDEDLLYVQKDVTQLLMALYNLIENAVKYSQGKPVDVRIFQQNGNLFISISDKGIGIPADQLEHISRPFYRADNANQIQGSGIGLSIALRILEKNNIWYEINSKMDIGTQVLLKFN